MLQFLQRIGKAVMLPIAALPIAGILLGVGGAFLGIAGLENAPAIYQPLLAYIYSCCSCCINSYEKHRRYCFW